MGSWAAKRGGCRGQSYAQRAPRGGPGRPEGTSRWLEQVRARWGPWDWVLLGPPRLSSGKVCSYTFMGLPSPVFSSVLSVPNLDLRWRGPKEESAGEAPSE